MRGCLREIEVTREDIPTTRTNGCWTIEGDYVGWGRNIFIETDLTVYCFCDERDGCNFGFKKIYSIYCILAALLLTMFIQLEF